MTSCVADRRSVESAQTIRTAVRRKAGGMLETRTFAGDAAELSDFVGGVWRATYAGRMSLPLWDRDFFQWQLLWRPPRERHYCIAAYDGSQLVGTLLGEEFRFRWFDRELTGTQGSWLSVHPEYRRQGVGGLLLGELKNRHRERGAAFQIGYGYHGSRLSLGPKFWKTYPKETLVPRSLGFWARVLDYPAVARWELSRLEGWGARMLGWWQRGAGRWAPEANVRDYREEDLPACLELAHALLDRVDVGIIWERERLRHQLSYQGFPRTLVYEQEGRAAGFVNYHLLEFLGHGTIRVGMVDLVALGELDPAAQRALLRTMLRRMADAGAALALVLRTPCFAWRPLWATGFIPRPADQAILLTRMLPEFDPGPARRFHVIWR